jgi:hypothetical protein
MRGFAERKELKQKKASLAHKGTEKPLLLNINNGLTCIDSSNQQPLRRSVALLKKKLII